MPVLPALPQPIIKQFMLPSTASLPEADQAWVKMDVSPINVQDSMLAEIGDTPFKISARALSERIKEWNFTEPDGTPVPITFENVLRLGNDLAYLIGQIPAPASSTLTTDQKKS